MKKLFFVFFCIFSLTSMAQNEPANNPEDSVQVIDMNRTFSVGGRALMCLKSKTADKKSVKALTWTLDNKRAGDQNFVHLEVKNAKTGQVEEFNSWNGGVEIRMVKKSNGTISYQVFDDTFSHLVISQLNKDKDIYVILYYSELLEK